MNEMYQTGVEYLIKNLNKKELLTTLALFSADTIDKFNLLVGPFNKLTPNLDPATRSRLKRKLIELNVLGECNKKLMLNPFTFIPKGTKDIRNCNWLTQRVWKYLFEDADNTSEEIIEHSELIFGEIGIKSKYIKVGSGKYSVKIPKPENINTVKGTI